MGVRGLRSFVREKRDKFLTSFKLQDTRLIIDGSNLLYFLHSHYEDENMYGGNYDHFSKRCKDFFKTLLRCNITPIVVFDGADDPDNMKLETIFKRLDEHFKKVNKWQKTEELLPILSKITLCQILTELSITHISCVYEADKEIAVLANKCACPVLSDDSDFYVYNLKHGSISMACMVESERTDLAGRYFLPVKLYKCQNVLKEVFEMENDEYMLPVFATLVGNDIFDPSKITLIDPKNPHHKLSCAKRNIRSVAEWIRKADFKSGEIALDQISRQMSEEEMMEFNTSVNSYLDIEEFSLFNLEAFLQYNKTGNLEDNTCETDTKLAYIGDKITSTCETGNKLVPLEDNIARTCETTNKLAHLDDNIASTCETTNQLAPLDDNIASTCETTNQLAPLDDNIAITCETANQRHHLDDTITSTHVISNQSKPLHANSDGTYVVVDKLAPLEENNKSTRETANQRKPSCNKIEDSRNVGKQLAHLNDNTDNTCDTLDQREPFEYTITRTCVKANKCDPSNDTIVNTHFVTIPRQPIYENICSRRETANNCQALDDNIDNTRAMSDKREPLENNDGILLDDNNAHGRFKYQSVHDIKETFEAEHIKLIDRNGNQLPFWFVKSAIDCKMDCSFLLNVAQNHRLIFKAQAEMHERMSSFKCSENIRRVIYRLILEPEKPIKHDQQRKLVKEYHRRWTDRSNVKPVERLDCISELPCLETIPLVSEIERKAIVYATFDASPTSLDQEMDETSQILILMLSLWKSNSYATECHLNALVIGILALHIFSPAGSILCTDILEAIGDTRKDKTDEFKKRMGKHFCKQDYLARRGINKEFIHNVSQFQAIFLHTYHLNQLLLSPVRIPSPGVILNSTFDYSMCHLLENNVEPKNILCGEESSLYHLFGRWKHAIKKQCKLARHVTGRRER